MEIKLPRRLQMGFLDSPLFSQPHDFSTTKGKGLVDFT